MIPCAYQLVDADIASWSLLASSEKLCLPLLADDAEAEVFEDCTLSEDFVSSTTDVESASDSMDASSAEDGSWNTIENEFGPTANPVEAKHMNTDAPPSWTDGWKNRTSQKLLVRLTNSIEIRDVEGPGALPRNPMK